MLKEDVLTLKHTHSEKGNVTITSSHDIAVRSHPQIPSPTSWSSAEIQKSIHGCYMDVWIYLQYFDKIYSVKMIIF